MDHRELNSVLMRLPRNRRYTALLIPLLACPATASAQGATVSVERENFRAAPRGTVIAELDRGTELTPGESRDRWREVTLEAWVWSASLREEQQDGYDLVVAAAEGENLRVTPNGTRVGRARPGMRLNRVETQDRWVRVRRTGWIWEPSLDVRQVDGPAEQPARPEQPPGAEQPAGAAPPGAEREFLAAGSRGLLILGAPAGDTLARVHPGGSVQVLGREGDWTRVRVEGWAVTASLTAEDTASSSVLRDISLAELQAEPEQVRGRLVEWTVQFIALQHAERFRTDFMEGEPFILARGPGDDAGFVYIAVPPEQEGALKSLGPLERFRVMGRVRTARSRLTDAPVIDLLEIRALRP